MKGGTNAQTLSKVAILNNPQVTGLSGTAKNIPMTAQYNGGIISLNSGGTVITMQESGLYLINACIQVGEQGAQYFCAVRLYINGNYTSVLAGDDNCVWDHTFQINTVFSLNVGDTVEFKISGNNVDQGLYVRPRDNSISFVKIGVR